MNESRYSKAELEEKLDDILCAALSSRRSAAAIAAGIAPLARAEQDFVLAWAEVAAQNVAELGYQFTAQAPQALAVLGRSGAEKWLLRALDAYDKEGLYPACAALKDLAGFKRASDAAGEGVALTEVARVLELFLRGLAGRRLQLEPATDIWTDTEIIFLPERIAAYPAREQNFRLYKAIVVHHWAQARYGTFNLELAPVLAGYAVPERALAWLNLLEALRLESQIGRGFPGLAALLAALRPAHPASLAAANARLSCPGSAVADSVSLLGEFYSLALPEPFPYMGSLHPERAAEVRGERIAKERRALYTELAQLRLAAQAERGEAEAGEPELDVDSAFDTLEFELEIDGEAVAPPEEVAKLMRSIIQDFGEIPEEYLLASGPGAYAAEALPPAEAAGEPGETQAAGGRLYDEWDFRRRDYRKDWCVLFESDVLAGDPGYVAAVRARYAGQIAQLRRRFEALRGEDRLARRQYEGEDIDFDAVVEAYADRKSGIEASERLFVQRRRIERNIAVMFMVDMSGSTKGWINACEREALVLLCEALEALGRPLRDLRLLRLDAQALRHLSHQDLRRDLWRGGARPHRRRRAARLHAHGRGDPASFRHPQRSRGEDAHPVHPVRRQARRFSRRLPRRLRHRGHAPGADRSAPVRHPSVLRHHRRRGARLSAAHVRSGELGADRRRRPVAAQNGGSVPAPDQLKRCAPLCRRARTWENAARGLQFPVRAPVPRHAHFIRPANFISWSSPLQIVCLDLEGVLVPEIWIEFSQRTGIPELAKTTRDEPDYDKLMRGRIDILGARGLGLSDIQDVIAGMQPLEGAREFLDWLRAQEYQVVILSDTYYQFAAPLMRALGYPTLFCHELVVDAGGRVRDYRLRMKDQKRASVKAFKQLNFRTIAAGDSYNDTAMLAEADAGILFCPPDNVVAEFPQFPVTRDYEELRRAVVGASSA